MRLNKKEIAIIKNNTNKIFGDSKIILFGSRMDDNKNGGDIDLYIIPENYENWFAKKSKLKSILEYSLYKPVDIVVSQNNNRLIEIEAQKGIEL